MIQAITIESSHVLVSMYTDACQNHCCIVALDISRSRRRRVERRSEHSGQSCWIIAAAGWLSTGVAYILDVRRMRSSNARPLRATRRSAAVRTSAAPSSATPLPFSPTGNTSHASSTAFPTSRLSTAVPHSPASVPFTLSPAVATHDRPPMPSSPAKRLKLTTMPSPSLSQPSSMHSSMPTGPATAAATTTRPKQLIHATAALSLALHSFIPEAVLRMYQQSEDEREDGDDDSNVVTGRVTETGWCIALSGDAAVLWRTADYSAAVSHSLTLSSIVSSAHLILTLPTSSDALRLIAITDDGDVCHWSASSTTSTAASIHQLPLTRDESCTRAVLLPASDEAVNSTSIAVGTSQGRILLLQLDTSIAQPRVIHTSESSRKGSTVWSSLASVGRILRWSKAAGSSTHRASDAEVVSLVWYRSAEDEGVFALTRDMLCQYSLAGDQPTLLYSSTLDELAPGDYQLRLESMTASSSSLYILFQRSDSSDDNSVSTHVATYSVDLSAQQPIDVANVLPVPSFVVDAVGVGVSERDSTVVHVWSRSGVAVLNATDTSIAPASFSFASNVVLGGGMEVERPVLHDGAVLPAYEDARCLLLCAGYGVVEVNDSWQQRPKLDELSSSVDSLSLQPRRADAESAEGALRVAFYLHTQGQSAASRMRVDDAWKHQLLPHTSSSTLPAASPQLDTIILRYAHSLIDTTSSALVTADRTPELLLDDLTSKQQSLQQFMQFLHANGLYNLLSASARVGLLTAGEQLAGLAGVRRLLNTFPDSRLKSDMEYVATREQVMLAVMRGCVQRRAGQAAAAAGGLGQRQISHRFFSEVTAVGDMFSSIADVVARECHIEATDSKDTRRDKAYALQAINTVIDTLLSAAARYRAEQAAVHTMPPSAPVPQRWTFQPTVRSMLHNHCAVVNECISAISSSAALSSLRVDLFQYLLRIARSLLLEYADYLTSHRTDSTVSAEFARTRASLVSLLRSTLPADQGSRRDVLYDFAAEFQDFVSLVSLADEETDALRESRLVAYLQQFGATFAGVLFDVYRTAGCTSRLLSIHEPAEYDNWLLQFLSQHRTDGGWMQSDGEVQWVQQVELGQWEAASETLVEVARHVNALNKADGHIGDDACTWSQQQTLWSLSKLALLCEDDVAADNPRLTEVNNQLDVSIAQAFAAERDINKPLLSPDLLIDRLLAVPHSRRRAVAADLPNLPPVRHQPLEEDMVSYYQAVEVYVKALHPLSHSSDKTTADELLVLEKVWYALYDADAAGLRQVVADWVGRVSDVWRSEVRRLHLYAMWHHLRLYDWYGRRDKFELSYEHFVREQVWRCEESDTQVKQVQEALKAIPQVAERE